MPAAWGRALDARQGSGKGGGRVADSMLVSSDRSPAHEAEPAPAREAPGESSEMTLFRSNPRATQRWTLLGMVVVAATLVAAIAAQAAPVNRNLFELDADATNDTRFTKVWRPQIRCRCGQRDDNHHHLSGAGYLRERYQDPGRRRTHDA